MFVSHENACDIEERIYEHSNYEHTGDSLISCYPARLSNVTTM